MDALEFLRERKRMCNLCKHCEGCPLDDSKCVIESSTTDEDCKRIVAAVEQWSKENPRKTRQSVFLEQWPEVELTKDGVISICPVAVSSAYRNKTGGCASPTLPRCAVCRREFWMQEVEGWNG